jgi:hypothetical protein
LDRKYQDRFVELGSELETIISTLEDQQRVLVAFEDSINAGESESVSVKSDGTKTFGREMSIIDFSLKATEESLQNFVEMLRHSTELESWVSFLLQSGIGN